jgi:hypothetical protein
MSEEEKYDELIRQKFAEQEFMFNEANWEKAEAMINASRKTKKIFWWSSIFLIGLITGIFLMLPLIKNNSSQTIIKKAKSNEHMVTDNPSMKSPSGKTTNESATDNTLSLNDRSPSPTETKEINTEANSNENNLIPAVDELNGARTKKQLYNKSAGSASGDESQKNKISKNNTIINAKKNKYSETNTDSQNAQETSRSLTPQKKRKEDKISENEKNAFAIAHKGIAIKNTIRHTAKEGDKTSKTEENQNEKTKSGELAKKETPSADAADSTLSENKLAAENAAKIDALNDSTKQEEKQLVADSVQKSDSVKLAAQEKSLTPALDGLASATFVSLDAGINGQLGWNNKEVIEGRGITPVLGIDITHAFNQTWSVSAGVQYNGIWYLKPDTKTAKTTIYDFGSTTTTITTKPGFLHYIAVPLTIQYHFNDKNAILAGGSFSCLLNAKSKVQESITRVGPALATGSISADNSNNNDYYIKTFNPFDAVIGIGYRRRISTRFLITGIADFGLLDVKQNSASLKNTFERNSGLRVILSYTIFDF